MSPTFKRIIGWAATGAAAWLVGRAVVRRRRRFDFCGRTVLITGGSRGLGLLLARRLAHQGARIAICARDTDELERARQDIANHGAEVIGLECDVTDRSMVEQTVRAVRSQWGEIDVLINNAGVIQVGPQREMTLEDYEQAMRVHYWGPLYATLAVLPEMRRSGSGRLVNIASIGGIISVPHLLPYSASKFALVGLSEGLRAELLKDGIYVTTVCPGLMRTGSPVQAQFKGHNEAEYAWFSVSASAPLASMSAERAADQILRACRNGQAHVVLSLPAKLASLIHGVAPGVTADTLGLTNQLLPGPGGIGTRQLSGRESRPHWLPSWLTHLGDKAAQRNNEIAPAPDAAGEAIQPTS
jgi:short-subunit dehydrogenase